MYSTQHTSTGMYVVTVMDRVFESFGTRHKRSAGFLFRLPVVPREISVGWPGLHAHTVTPTCYCAD